MKNMGVATGGALLATSPWLNASARKKEEGLSGQKARIGMIGTGSRGQYNLDLLLHIPRHGLQGGAERPGDVFR